MDGGPSQRIDVESLRQFPAKPPNVRQRPLNVEASGRSPQRALRRTWDNMTILRQLGVLPEGF